MVRIQLRDFFFSWNFLVLVFSFLALPFSPLVCLSASEAQTDSSLSLSGHESYIQGAGDDEEAWAMGLVPKLFWDNVDTLLRSDLNEGSALMTD